MTESDLSAEERVHTPFERGGAFTSSFHGDRYFQEDIYKVTDHVKVAFGDVFREPAALRTGDIGRVLSRPVTRINSLVFIYSQAAIYYFLTFTTGVFLVLGWGVLFGALNFGVVWVMQPAIKSVFVLLRVVAMPTRAGVRAFCDPVFQSAGQIFSFISVKFRLKVFGIDSPVLPEVLKDIRDVSNNKPGDQAKNKPQEWLGFV